MRTVVLTKPFNSLAFYRKEHKSVVTYKTREHLYVILAADSHIAKLSRKPFAVVIHSRPVAPEIAFIATAISAAMLVLSGKNGRGSTASDKDS